MIRNVSPERAMKYRSSLCVICRYYAQFFIRLNMGQLVYGVLFWGLTSLLVFYFSYMLCGVFLRKRINYDIINDEFQEPCCPKMMGGSLSLN